MNKKLTIIITAVLLAVLAIISWLAFKPYDYSVEFESKTLPGTINQTLKVWSMTLSESDILESPSIDYIKQRIRTKNTTYFYNWKLRQKSDSLTLVRVEIIDSTQHNLSARLLNLFKNTAIKESSKKYTMTFLEVLNDHLASHKVKIDQKSISPSLFCAYIPLKAKQPQKAKGMMEHYNLLSDFSLKHKLELNGKPLVEVTKWETKTDSIQYNFCFPIVKTDSLPTHPEIKYKQIDSKKSLKATYHGNYISSDRAWYALLNHAKKNAIEVDRKPIEVFYNNPMQGGDDTQWKTEVYLPIKDQ